MLERTFSWEIIKFLMHGLKNHAQREIVNDNFSGHLPSKVILAVQLCNVHPLFWKFPF